MKSSCVPEVGFSEGPGLCLWVYILRVQVGPWAYLLGAQDLMHALAGCASMLMFVVLMTLGPQRCAILWYIYTYSPQAQQWFLLRQGEGGRGRMSDFQPTTHPVNAMLLARGGN